MLPQTSDIKVWVGSTPTYFFRPKHKTTGVYLTAEELEGSTFIFRAVTPGGAEILRKALSPVADRIPLSLSAEETRLIKLGRLCRYELERRIADQQEPWRAGYLIGSGRGDNDDL